MHSEKDSAEPGDNPTGPRPRDRSPSEILLYVGCISAVVLLGFWLRVDKLSEPIVGHSEIYIPGIDLPEQSHFPTPRNQLVKTILSVIHSEPHPPGFYIAMFGWTKVFGTSEIALRMPVVLAGTGVILLAGVIGAQLACYRAGFLAALILATNPTCIAFDRLSRMYPMATFAAVAGTSLLIWSYRSSPWQRMILIGYLGMMALGLSCTVFFWPLLGAHLAFSILGPRVSNSSSPPAQVYWQLWLMIIASPLVSIAIYQSGRPSYMSTVLFEQLVSYVQLFYAFPVQALELPTRFTVLSSYGLVLAVISGIFIVLGIYWIASKSEMRDAAYSARMGWSMPLQWLTTLFSVVVIGLFTYAQTIFENYHEDRTNLLIASTVLPVIFCAIAFALQRRWETFSRAFDAALRSPLGLNWIVVSCAILPVAFVAAVTAIGMPLLEARTIYVAAPFLALLFGTGAMAVPSKWLGTASALVVILSANVLGTNCYAERFGAPVDYPEVVEGINQHHHEADLILIKNNYSLTPVFYHLEHRRMNLVFYDYAAAIGKQPNCRAWVFQPEGLPVPKDIEKALGNHHRELTVEAKGMSVHLYEPSSATDNQTPTP